MQWPHDPNLTIQVLCQVIFDHFNNLVTKSQPLPRKLFLQLDNTARENKNRCALSFLSLLVHKGIFEEVELGFLNVGHTHEDVDAMFGNFVCLSLLKCITNDGMKTNGNQKVNKTLPIGCPNNVAPNSLKIDLEALSRAISKYQCLDEVDRKWWTDFIEELKESFVSPAPEPEQWLLSKVQDIVENASATTQSIGQSSLPDQLLKRHMETTESIPELASVHHGGFVALKLKKYEDKEPQIAQVVDIDGKMLTIDWWIVANSWSRKLVKEAISAQNKKQSVIVSGVVESGSTYTDLAVIKELFGFLGDDRVIPIAIEAFRLGKEPINGKPRLLKVRLSYATQRSAILQKAKLLKGSENFKEILVRPSYTVIE
ncbi:hypothetical protein EMCRGX_G023439 [Ephydatia muelleri]